MIDRIFNIVAHKEESILFSHHIENNHNENNEANYWNLNGLLTSGVNLVASSMAAVGKTYHFITGVVSGKQYDSLSLQQLPTEIFFEIFKYAGDGTFALQKVNRSFNVMVKAFHQNSSNFELNIRQLPPRAILKKLKECSPREGYEFVKKYSNLYEYEVLDSLKQGKPLTVLLKGQIISYLFTVDDLERAITSFKSKVGQQYLEAILEDIQIYFLPPFTKSLRNQQTLENVNAFFSNILPSGADDFIKHIRILLLMVKNKNAGHSQFLLDINEQHYIHFRGYKNLSNVVRISPYNNHSGYNISFGRPPKEKGILPHYMGIHLYNMYLSNYNWNKALLIDAVLKKCNFYSTNLTEANLCGADLEEASFKEAVLNDADLSNSILKNTYMIKVRLNKANLTNANLEGANLTDAQLVEANLSGAIFTNANFTDTTFFLPNIFVDTTEKKIQADFFPRLKELLSDIKASPGREIVEIAIIEHIFKLLKSADIKMAVWITFKIYHDHYFSDHADVQGHLDKHCKAFMILDADARNEVLIIIQQKLDLLSSKMTASLLHEDYINDLHTLKQGLINSAVPADEQIQAMIHKHNKMGLAFFKAHDKFFSELLNVVTQCRSSNVNEPPSFRVA